MRHALPWLLFTYLLAPASLFCLLVSLRAGRARRAGLPAEAPELAIVSLALAPLLIHWLVVGLYGLLPGYPSALYRWAPVVVFVTVAVAGRRSVATCAAVVRGALGRVRPPVGLDLVTIAAVSLLLQRTYDACLHILTKPVFGNDDALQYATVARLVYERRETAFYIFQAADPVTGFYVPMTHPLGFPAALLWGYLMQGHADFVGLGVAFEAWALVVTMAMVACALRRHAALVAVLGAGSLLAAPFYQQMLAGLAVDPPLALCYLTLVMCLVQARRGAGRVWCGLSGLALGMCLFMHSVGLLALPLATGAWCVLRGRARARETLLFAIAMVAVALLIGGHQYLENQLLRGRPAGDDNAVWALPALHVERWFQEARGLEGLPGRLGAFLQCWTRPQLFGALPWLGLAGALLAFRRELGPATALARTAGLILAGFLTLVGGLTFGLGSDLVIKNPRYFLFLQPLLAVPAALVLERLVDLAGARGPPDSARRAALLVGVLALLVPFGPRMDLVREAGPALFHQDYTWRIVGETGLAQVMQFVRDETPPDATVLAHPMAHYGFYTRRRLLSDLDPRLVDLYVLEDPGAAAAMLRRLDVDYIATPTYSIPTFQGTVVERVVADPTLCELAVERDGVRLYRLRSSGDRP